MHPPALNLDNLFLVLGPERTGTTFIRDMIAENPNISILNDDLNSESPFFKKGIDIFTFGNATIKEKERGFLHVISALASINSNELTLAAGCKMNFQYPYQIQRFYNILVNFLPGVKIIIVTRKDLIAQYASFIRMHLTGITHSTHSIKSYLKVKKFSISSFFLKKYVYQQLIIIDYLQKLKESHPVLELNYEQNIIGFNQDIADAIFQFLEVPSIKIKKHSTRQKKISPGAEEYVKNYKKLYPILKNINKESVIENKHKYMRKSFKNYYLLYKSLTVREIGILKQRIRDVLTKRSVIEQGKSAGDG